MYYEKPLSGVAFDAFDRFITRNSYSLSAVSVLFNDVVSLEKMDSVLPIFLNCSVLEEVFVEQISQNMVKCSVPL